MDELDKELKEWIIQDRDELWDEKYKLKQLIRKKITEILWG